MSKTRIARYLATGIIYLALVASVFGFNIIRARTAALPPTQPEPQKPPTILTSKPYYSLTTNRSYSPNESARLWASYQNIDYLDFRVYRIKDPSKFFKQLEDPHEMGEKEKAEIAQAQTKAYRWTFLLSGMTHPNFDRTLRELTETGHSIVSGLAQALC